MADRGEIVSAELDENKLTLYFRDGDPVSVSDKRNAVSERRFITCDDDLRSFVGSRLLSISIKYGPTFAMSKGDSETAFVEVLTTSGAITLTTHNEHNGFYGGFDLCISDGDR